MQPEEGADAAWVAQLAHVPLARAERSIEEARAERSLFRFLEREHASEGRSSYIEIDAPLELFALVRLLRPRHVVEVGVSSGVSSAYLLQGLNRNRRGTLHSVDLPSFPRPRRTGARRGGASWSLPPGRSSGWAVPLALRGRWDLRLGDKRTVLPLLIEELPGIDLFVYDVPHDDSGSWREFQRLDPLLNSGSVAIADHGPTAGLCAALGRWARRRDTAPVGRTGLGLYGFACP
ncbi:MAG: class I SAM-dependent methyltransferase [Thermoplasmata archaeon]|nr:class I SAM-dependent methyltransferase [Thermoplasmata archaeon]